MTREQHFFIDVLADYINMRKTHAQVDLDWPVIFSYAHSHQVEGVLYYQCKSFIPSEASDRLKQLYASNLFFYANRIKQYKEIAQKFYEEEIPFYMVKGLEVAESYPVPSLRTMGDCDIVVRPVDKGRAHQAMLSLEYENDMQQDMEWTYFRNNLEFEIHDHLLYDETVNTQISKDFTESAWENAKEIGDTYRHKLDWSFHFVFLLLHLKKHFLNSGVGFRQFMDLTVIVQNQNLDWGRIKEVLINLELLDFAKVCCAFCERWFDVKIPLNSDLDGEFFELSTQKIFSNGVFGFDDADNKANANLNRIQKDGKMKTIIGRIFPTYKDVKYVPHYSFVNGRPWLLPVVWIYRLFRSVLYGKSADGVKLIGSAVGSDSASARRNMVLKQWGL